MNFLFYIVQVNLYLILFYTFYRLVLFGETFHNLNRVYLVASALLSFGIPLWYSEYVQSWFITKEINAVFYSIYDPSLILVRPTEQLSFTWADAIKGLYIFGIIIFSIRLFVTLLQLMVVLRNKNFEKFSAFSFFGYSFVDDTLKKRDTILAHEHVHVQQLHSADVLIFELIAILNWFNPIVYFYKKNIKHIHEFIADDIASRKEASKADYAILLFTQEFGLQPHQLTHHFFTHSTLKRRIQMLNKPRSRQIMLLKYGLSVPLFILMLVLSSATIIKHEVFTAVEDKVNNIINTQVSLAPPPPPTELTIDKAKANIITGKVTSAEDGNGIPGVIIEVVDKNSGTTTDARGEYKINALPDDKLRFTFPGFETAVVPVANKNAINVTLKVKNNTVSLKESTPTLTLKANNNEDVYFTAVEQNPEFPGGIKAMYNFISNNLKYPIEAVENRTSGKVFVRFIVRKDGSITDLKILKGIGYGCDEETVRVFSQMPKWNPGTQNGIPVNVAFTAPVNFTLGENNTTTFTTSPDNVAIRFRGINADKQLFLVNGKEVSIDLYGALNPDSIERVEILKGEEAIKQYGEKGKYGVIIIQTKLNKKN